MDIFFGIIITILSVIGLKTIVSAAYGAVISGVKGWDAKISISVAPTSQTPLEQLVDTLEYIKTKYLPEMEICILCSDINKFNDRKKDTAVCDNEIGIQTR